MHTKYTMGNERALPETCIISAFELLRYQNVKRYQWKKKKHYQKLAFYVYYTLLGAKKPKNRKNRL